ncbi:MAG: hypothetical protein AB8I08_23740 [Sandaracinaceae bacterium]
MPHALPDALVVPSRQDAVDGHARLEATPASTATVRAMAIRAGWPTLD